MIKKNTRMSIDVNEDEHKKIKMRAAQEGVSIRKFVMECVQSKIFPDQNACASKNSKN